MLVNNSSKQVAAIAQLLRTVVDEIIIGIDSKCDPDSMKILKRYSDVCFRIELSHDFANSSWLIHQAKNEWVLILDGDEVPSVNFIERLRHLHRIDSSITHAYFNRRWIWPDIDTYLTSEPWRDDPQLRLVRRDARIFNWPNGLHEEIDVDGIGIFLPEIFYHIDLVNNSLVKREEKVRRYNSSNQNKHPGFKGTTSEIFYLPETQRPIPLVSLLPDDDRANILKVVQGELTTKKITQFLHNWIRNDFDLLSQHEIISRGTQENLRQCSLEFMSPPTAAIWGVPIRVFVKVTNTSNWIFQPHRHNGGIAIGWSLSSSTDPFLVLETGRSGLQVPLSPGESALLPCYVNVPDGVNEALIHFSLVEEFREWFPELVSLTIQAGNDLFDA